MTAKPDPTKPRLDPGWALLAIALGWVALARVPLVLNARAHLDSDLAVDGLTLVDALNGHWRWHYPGTPFIGIPPVLLSFLQARVWGPTPEALVSGGVVAYGLVVAATYWLNRRAFGASAASWGLVPLAFGSTGLIWLSGRVTGGHLLAAGWHAGAFATVWGALTRGGWARWAAVGLWCGLGLWVDSMAVVTWAGVGVAWLAWIFSSSPLLLGEGPGVGGVASPPGWKKEDSGAAGRAAPLIPGPSPKGRGEKSRARPLACLLAFALAGGLGVLPRLIGSRVDPHDAYVGQFTPDLRPGHLLANARILVRDCLPRLVAGHRLPGFQAEPDPGRASPKGGPGAGLAVVVSGVAIALFGWSMAGLAIGGPAPDPAARAIRLGLLASTMAVVAGFLAYPSISDSDHYRYLVTLVVPWSSGFGLAMARLAATGRSSRWRAGLMAAGFAGLMTVDSARWYAGLGWVDPAGRPTRKRVEDPALAWLDDHPEVSTILGDYWDAYRLSFLTGGRVRAVPFPQYPDRFPEDRRGLTGPGDPALIARPGPFGPPYRDRALRAGGVELFRARGVSIVRWPGGLSP